MNNRREQTIGAALFVLLILAGWAPFFLSAVFSGVYDAPPILLGGFFAILAAGFTYDAAERIFGAGKGVYTTAILVSFAPAAIILSEPPLLAETSLMFVTAASFWFASRATNENSREALAFIALLSAISFAVFGFWPPALLPLLALLVVRAKANVRAQNLLIAIGVATCGLIVKTVMRFDLPEMSGHQPNIALTFPESVVLLAPWFALIVLAIFDKAIWTRAAMIGAALLTLMHLQFDGAWVGILGAASPLLALAMTSVVLRWFDAESEAGLRNLRWFVMPIVLVLTGFAVARIAHYEVIASSHNFAVLGLLVAGLLIAAAIKDARRWIFALIVVAGLLISALWWYYWQFESSSESAEPSFDLLPWLTSAIIVFRLGVALLYGRRMPRKLRAVGPRHRFDEVVFRKFSNDRRYEWEGKAVTVSPQSSTQVKFAIFGDVAGSESVFSSRRSGYNAFNKLVKAISDRKPDFAVSTGDLATFATYSAYRRLRVLLRKMSFPFIATPGNHDIVYRGEVHSQYFHALFGSDHGDITLGPVRMILINNAWGSLTDEQWLWVDATFAKSTTAASTIVFCHKPVFDPREGENYSMEWRPHAERLHNLFVTNHVTAVFSGHIHSLLHAEKEGVHYVISGGGGSKLSGDDDVHHFLWCEATLNGLHLTAHGVDRNDVLFDVNMQAKL